VPAHGTVPPNAERARIRPVPIVAILHPANKQNVAFGRWPEKKMLIYDERSWNVYENKQTIDTMTD
jgi:hypothetical protein